MPAERQSHAAHDDGLDTGRFEGQVLNTQALALKGELEAAPYYGSIVDPANDDEVELRAARDNRRLIDSVNYARVKHEVDEDFEAGQAYLRSKYDALLEEGMSPEEARLAALGQAPPKNR